MGTPVIPRDIGHVSSEPHPPQGPPQKKRDSMTDLLIAAVFAAIIFAPSLIASASECRLPTATA